MKRTTLLLAFITAFTSFLSRAQQSPAGSGADLPGAPVNRKITIFMIGNSTMADKPYAVEKGGNPEKGWGQILPLYFNEGISIENHAVNGRSSKSFINEGRWEKVRDAIRPGDYVIMEFGHNDQKEYDTTRYAAAETDYRSNLLMFVRETKARGGIPVLATPIMRRRFDGNGVFYDTHGKYPEVVRELAAAEKVPLLDLHRETRKLLEQFGEVPSKALFLHISTFEYASLPEGRSDDTHLSAYGAFKVCDLAAAEIRQNIPALAAYLKP